VSPEKKEASKTPKRVMSGMRTTGPLHVGHYFGALKNWLRLQDQYECFFGAMDYHALTDKYKTPEIVRQYNREYIIDWISFGLDPNKVVFFIQSEVPEHIELFTIFSMITPIGWLERVNTWKDAEEELKAKDAHNLGRFAYPVLQAADIAIYRGDLVPVGQDQVPHLELAREIVRRFNHLYKTQLPEPKPLLTDTPAIPGLDGRKMSSSYGNFIPLITDQPALEKIIKPMPTDPARIKRMDPGNPEVCPVFGLHKLFSSEQDRAVVDRGCRTAGIGCIDCKMVLVKNINAFMAQAREVKAELSANPKRVDEIIGDGIQKARRVAQETMKTVRSALGWK